jgi:hypothetical protein
LEVTDVSEEHVASAFKAEEKSKLETRVKLLAAFSPISFLECEFYFTENHLFEERVAAHHMRSHFIKVH